MLVTGITDLNEVDGCCFFKTGVNPANNPGDGGESSYYYGVQLEYTPAYRTQIAMTAGSSRPIVRSCRDGKWSTWDFV